MTDLFSPAAPGLVESRDPSTGEVWARFETTGEDEVLAAVAQSRTAAQTWKTRPVRDRSYVLERFRRRSVERRESIASLISRETGKSETESLFEVFGAAEFAHYYARLAPRKLSPRRWRSSNLAIWRKTIRTKLEPFGVIGIITPWNYPFLLATGLVLPALVAGNGVVLKPSERTPSSAEMLHELLLESGLPGDLLQVVHGAGQTGAALVSSGVDKIFFIGSEASGRKVSAGAAATMTPCVLELGGSDPAIVLRDAHLPTAAKGIAWGRFVNAGQTCVAPKRVFVVDEVYDEFLDHLRSVMTELSEGGKVGPLISEDQTRAIRVQLDDAIGRGARIVAGGSSVPEGTRFPPTVLVDVAAGMKVLEEETFGPLLPVVRVRDEEEAIARANATSYGLSASVWSRDVARATEVARRIEAGTVTINDSAVVALIADMSYGGVKASGTGRTHGEAGLMECVRSHSILVDRFARFRESYWHFYGKDVRQGFDGFIEFTHGRGLLRRLLAGLRAVWLLYLKRS